MKICKFSLSVLLAILSETIFSQPSQFNINEYKQFLASNNNLQTSQLLEMYPAGSFKGDLNLSAKNAFYFDSIISKYHLTEFEKSLIDKSGFMVSERLSNYSFGEAFLDIYSKDLPVFVSTDAILHALHMSYDNILKDVELGFLIDKVKFLLTQLHSNLPALELKYSSYNNQMKTMLKDVDVYLTVPRKLLGEQTQPYFSENITRIDSILNMIENEQGYVQYSLFSEKEVIYDWSQFKPRGHYTDEMYPILAKYFRAMIWLGKIEIYLLSPQATLFPSGFKDLQRQIIDAMLIRELFDLANANSMYNEIEHVLKFFIGESDNVTLPNLDYLKQAINLSGVNQLLDSSKCAELQDTLKNQSFAYQLILSQILISNDPLSPDSIAPASAFLLFGLRFVIDSYVTGSVVYDRIFFNGKKVCRLFPSTLDPMFALGNDAAAQLLQPELNTFHYSTNLAALRYLIDSYGTDFWNSSIYNMWLNSIRKLNPPKQRELLPQFMQTGAFWQEKLNTQLTSWTQLRHDNLLYAKQSYTGGTTCSFPYSYVEPFPEFYNNIETLAEACKQYFQSANFGEDYLRQHIIEYFSNLSAISDTLSTIAYKEINNISCSEMEIEFLHKMIYSVNNGYSTSYDGWYSRLYYKDYGIGLKLLEWNALVADIHTTPTDCNGGVIGAISHVGTGPINLGVFIAESNGQNMAYVGPIFSYYEYRTHNFLRLTDEEWKQTYLQAALRPDWVNIYLADSSGNSKGAGQSLITNISDENPNISYPNDFLNAGNYPNPFNPETIIWFKIPSNLTNSSVELNVYDINGELVNSLVSDILSSGNYLVKWNGLNEMGKDVSSGIYFYHLKVADKLTTGKMILMR